jgi:hypothetical protein
MNRPARRSKKRQAAPGALAVLDPAEAFLQTRDGKE